ncbi:DUF1304 domain-containing protein [Williamsia sp. DF01-3]|uniref:DUF1304 domain-containing protein n=1 Tax=Williamsia sp. DF01-3 TaxID=2934157 RepID=UPI001FF1AC05|nr:DUF1304 domain-containing protein [Williamsia sp. DF01-3]MCK0517198.1 DUF1304 domain-containing protein [Williamsia sp. DF01-3]
MTVVGLVFTAIAALIHVYIFVLESLRWTAPATRTTFGTTAEEAEATKEMAFNQGFYNLFLAIVTAVGIVLTLVDHADAGAALVFASAGSMVAAGLVLLISSPEKGRSALIQLTPPAIGVAALVAGLVF